MMKESEDNTNQWKSILCSRIGRINFVKMFIVLTANQRLNAISIKIPKAIFFFYRNRKLKILKLQKTPNSQRNPEKEEQSRRHHISQF